MDALLDPNGSDDEWRKDVFALLGDDGAGRAIRSPTRRAGGGPSAASAPDPYARGQYDDKYVNYAYTCTSDGRWEGSVYGCHPVPAVLDDEGNQLPDPGRRRTVIHDGSAADRQPGVQHGALADGRFGNWHVTVYCPAALDAPLLDKDANELDP